MFFANGTITCGTTAAGKDFQHYISFQTQPEFLEAVLLSVGLILKVCARCVGIDVVASFVSG
jgi:hypothetical protein